MLGGAGFYFKTYFYSVFKPLIKFKVKDTLYWSTIKKHYYMPLDKHT